MGLSHLRCAPCGLKAMGLWHKAAVSCLTRFIWAGSPHTFDPHKRATCRDLALVDGSRSRTAICHRRSRSRTPLLSRRSVTEANEPHAKAAGKRLCVGADVDGPGRWVRLQPGKRCRERSRLNPQKPYSDCWYHDYPLAFGCRHSTEPSCWLSDYPQWPWTEMPIFQPLAQVPKTPLNIEGFHGQPRSYVPPGLMWTSNVDSCVHRLFGKEELQLCARELGLQYIVGVKRGSGACDARFGVPVRLELDTLHRKPSSNSAEPPVAQHRS